MQSETHNTVVTPQATRRPYQRRTIKPPIEEGQFIETKKYNSNEAAAALGISREWLRKIRADGNIKFRIGKHSGRAVYMGRDLARYYFHSSLL